MIIYQIWIFLVHILIEVLICIHFNSKIYELYSLWRRKIIFATICVHNIKLPISFICYWLIFSSSLSVHHSWCSALTLWIKSKKETLFLKLIYISTKHQSVSLKVWWKTPCAFSSKHFYSKLLFLKNIFPSISFTFQPKVFLILPSLSCQE